MSRYLRSSGKRSVESGTILTILLISILTIAFGIQPVEASGTIYIRPDGSVDPPGAPIQRDGDIYTFTDNIYDNIVVEKDNIVVDGAGYTLQAVSGYGIDLSGRSYVTIKNTDINSAIWLDGSSKNTISGNKITTSWNGILLYFSSNYNTISGNNIVDNVNRGITLYESSNNNIFGNHIVNNGGAGIMIAHFSNQNTICENNIVENDRGIYFEWPYSSSGNWIYHNNIIDNTQQASTWGGEVGGTNIWDDDYPSGGNYWSDYTGVDLYNGPNQDQPGSDGIGDTPYVIDEKNQDNYPFVKESGWVARVRDVVATSQIAFETEVEPGTPVEIEVEVKTLGEVTESFDVTCYYDSDEIGTLRVESLAPGESTTVTFTWDTTSVPVNEYLIMAWADSGEEIDEDNNWCQMKVPVFVIPELPLGTITALISTLAALVLFTKRPRARGFTCAHN